MNKELRIMNRGFGTPKLKAISYKLRATPRGFTVLYSVLIASVLLAIGISIFNLTLKDILFSSSGRESQFAFYAADTGIECALYWDKKGINGNTIFATSTDSINPPPLGSAFCNEEDITENDTNFIWPPDLTQDPLITTFYLNRDNNPGKICAVVRVYKYISGDKADTTEIESRGYNTCEPGNPRRIERGIRATY